MIWWAIAVVIGLDLLVLPLLLERMRRPVGKAVRVQARKQDKEQFAKLSRGVTHYRWHGHVGGPVAVCVHGQTTPSFVWGVIEEILVSMGFRVLTYDLYGRGLSDRPKDAQTAEFFAEQLEELLESQGVEDEITLLGYSMGGAVATAFAARRPDRLERLVLIAPTGLGHDPTGFFGFVARWPFLGDWLFTVFGGLALRRGIRAEAKETPSFIEDFYQLQMAETRMRGFLPAVLSSMRHMRGVTQEAEHREIAATELPVLAIWGESDPIIPRSGIGTLAAIHRDVHQVEVPGAGHAVAYSHPEEVRAALQEFMRDGL
ncbi:MAG: alpha/beta fold hydrolase [Halocynthiibacter sp.]